MRCARSASSSYLPPHVPTLKVIPIHALPPEFKPNVAQPTYPPHSHTDMAMYHTPVTHHPSAPPLCQVTVPHLRQDTSDSSSTNAAACVGWIDFTCPFTHIQLQAEGATTPRSVAAERLTVGGFLKSPIGMLSPARCASPQLASFAHKQRSSLMPALRMPETNEVPIVVRIQDERRLRACVCVSEWGGREREREKEWTKGRKEGREGR